ncbi:MAG: type II toxin-antitoxin system RelE/ParE family toxin [Verrucomicrobiota bacterium]
MKTAFVTELAASDLEKIWFYIACHNPDAADRMIDRLKAACEMLAQSPTKGKLQPGLAKDIRRYRVGNYYIFYFPTTEGIEVARFLHGARDLPRMF